VDVVFIADGTPQYTTEFSPSLLWDRGLGGTEASIITAAEAVAAAGCAVTVVPPGNVSEIVARVCYTPAAAIRDRRFDVAVLFKSHSPTTSELHADRRIFWPTDAVAGIEGYAAAFAWCDTTVYISSFQQEFIAQTYGKAPGAVFIVPWAIRTEDYDPAPCRENILLYCSVPNRGLAHLANLFPRIRSEIPDAALIVTSDFSLWGRDEGTAPYRALFHDMEGVEYRARVSRHELVALQQQAKILAYPCTFPEAFCVAAAECMAAGCVPITTSAYALPTTIGASGVLVRERPGTERFASEFVGSVVALLADDAVFRAASQCARESALTRFSGEALARAFLAIVA
jgi:glycosyltransferase involved in cell wall biosynthesis